MKRLDLTVFEPGDMLATMSKEGAIAVFTVAPDGNLLPGDQKEFNNGITFEDPIEVLNLSTRSYNLIKREGINTVRDLVRLVRDEGRDGLAAMRNMNPANIEEILAAAARVRGETITTSEPQQGKELDDELVDPGAAPSDDQVIP